MDDDSGDYSIEVDPREADWSTMGLLRELGFNRVSVGLQDLDPVVQRAVNRLQSLEETRAVIEAARTLQFRSINIDLIYGLPKQTPDNFARTVEEVINLQPDRLSVFNYAPAGALHASAAHQQPGPAKPRAETGHATRHH
jgi:oxygen-independent coproporphyrinogen-3 oxidase